MSRSTTSAWRRLNQAIETCDRCPRLIAYCKSVGAAKRRAYQDDAYWARPVSNFGAAPAEILIVGLAPGAHGANRTGRMFTGDQSGVWLYRALHRAGLATQVGSHSRQDELQLVHCAITSACHCAPPENKPLRQELANCQPWFGETMALVQPRVIVALGQIAWNAILAYAVEQNWTSGPRPPFGHGRIQRLAEQLALLGCYHPSQQNTFTGRLTEAMLDKIMERANRMAGLRRKSNIV